MKRRIIRGLIVLTLVGLTLWNFTRSEKLDAATAAYRSKRYVPALQAAVEHLRVRPWSRDASRVAALSLSQLDYSTQAETYYAKAGELPLDDLLVRAYAIVRSNRRDDAIKAYREILQRWPNDPVALRNIATVYLSQYRNREGVEFAERLALLPGHEVIGSTMMGSLFHRLGESERSVAAFDRVRQLDPDLKVMPLPLWQFHLYYGEELINVGRSREAVDLLQAAVAASPDNLLVLDRLGMAFESLGQLDDAEATWRIEVDRDQGAGPAWANLGKLALIRNQPDRAVELLRKAVELQPKSYTALYNLLLATQRLGLKDEAKAVKVRLDAIKAKQGAPTMSMGSSVAAPEDSHD